MTDDMQSQDVESGSQGRLKGQIIILIAIAFLGAVLWWVLRGMPS